MGIKVKSSECVIKLFINCRIVISFFILKCTLASKDVQLT